MKKGKGKLPSCHQFGQFVSASPPSSLATPPAPSRPTPYHSTRAPRPPGCPCTHRCIPPCSPNPPSSPDHFCSNCHTFCTSCYRTTDEHHGQFDNRSRRHAHFTFEQCPLLLRSAKRLAGRLPL